MTLTFEEIPWPIWRHCKIRYVWHDPETMSVHLDGDFSGATIYPSLKALQENKHCVAAGECGVVKVSIKIVEVIKDEDF